MSGLGKALLALGVLVITNLGTFGYATWRCRQEAEGTQRLLAEAQQKQRAAEAQNAAAEQRLERLRVWGELLELQRDVNGVHAVINQLNFGNAIQAIDRVETRLRQGEYGQLFRQRAPELLPLLEQAKGALRNTDPMARTYLVELDQRAFGILAATAGPGELPGLTALEPAATPVPSPFPSPLPGLFPEATPGLESVPSPTLTPKPGSAAKPTPTPTPKSGVI
jgi:hypothetical protein